MGFATLGCFTSGIGACDTGLASVGEGVEGAASVDLAGLGGLVAGVGGADQVHTWRWRGLIGVGLSTVGNGHLSGSTAIGGSTLDVTAIGRDLVVADGDGFTGGRQAGVFASATAGVFTGTTCAGALDFDLGSDASTVACAVEAGFAIDGTLDHTTIALELAGTVVAALLALLAIVVGEQLAGIVLEATRAIFLALRAVGTIVFGLGDAGVAEQMAVAILGTGFAGATIVLAIGDTDGSGRPEIGGLARRAATVPGAGLLVAIFEATDRLPWYEDAQATLLTIQTRQALFDIRRDAGLFASFGTLLAAAGASARLAVAAAKDTSLGAWVVPAIAAQIAISALATGGDLSHT